MQHIMGKPYEIPAYAPHLKAFTEVERGPALRREGPERRYRYRFVDPLLQPFIVLTALSEDWLPNHYRDSLFAQVGTAGDTQALPPTEPDPLFSDGDLPCSLTEAHWARRDGHGPAGRSH